jgi:hypothetical protein
MYFLREGPDEPGRNTFHRVPNITREWGCGFAFADGHSESHKWFSPAPKKDHRAPIANPQDFKNWNWMRDRTSAHISGTMPPPQ